MDPSADFNPGAVSASDPLKHRAWRQAPTRFRARAGRKRLVRFPLVLPIVLLVLLAGVATVVVEEASFRARSSQETKTRSAGVLSDLVRQVGELRRAHETYVRLLAHTPGLEAAAAAHNSSMLAQLLLPIQRDQAFDEITVYDADGGEMLHLGPPKGDRIDTLAFAAGAAGKTTSESLVDPSGVVVLASTPIPSDAGPVGVLVAASTFTDSNVGQLRGHDGVEVAFFQNGNLVSSSIRLRALRRVVEGAALTPAGLRRLNSQLGPFHFHAAVEAMAGGELLGLASTADIQAFTRQRQLIALSAAGLFLALLPLLVLFLSRTVVRPLKAMAAVTSRMQLGDYSRRVAPSRVPELDALGSAVNYLAEQVESQIDNLSYQAFHDHLTGLPNRALFIDRLGVSLARTKRHGKSAAVVFFDLDDFKLVNDTLGHEVADELLVAVAARLEGRMRAEDTLARLGGDEFTVLLEDIGGRSDALIAAERIRVALEAPFSVAGHELFVPASLGIALAAEHDDAVMVLRKADLAMYRAKATGKDCCVVFDETLSAELEDKLRFQTELRFAVERNQLRLDYQPIVDLRTGELIEVEALLRWMHPTHGLVPPDAFIPIAEATGSIMPIGLWVLEEACRQSRSWRRFDGQPVTVSVNLSPRQLEHDDLVADVKRILADTGFDPRLLKLEITESTLVARNQSTLDLMSALTDFGVRFVVDDFGIGYSSLSYFRHFPVRGVKIDKAFVDGLHRNPQDHAIVRAIVGLADALSLEVTAEGVEDQEQPHALRALHCERAQGYYFSRPVPADEIARLLVSGPLATKRGTTRPDPGIGPLVVSDHR